MDPSQPQYQPPMAQEGMYQEPTPGYPPPFLKPESSALGMRLSIGTRTARIINCVGFFVFAGVIAYETFNLRSFLGGTQGMNPYRPSAVTDGGYFLAAIILLLIIPNCLGFCVRNKSWTAYLWIVTNAVGTLLMLGWLVIVFSDGNMYSLRPASGAFPGAPSSSLRFLSFVLFLVFGGLGILFTFLVMFPYAKILEGQAQSSPEEMANMGPPTGTLSANQVQPVVSNYSQAPPPPAPV